MFILLQGNININITITIINVSSTTTATGGIPFSTHQRGATPCHDCNPAAAGQYHAPPIAREQSGGCKTSSFNGRMEEVSAFVNAACLYIRMKMTEEAAATQVAWVLSYVQGGIAEAWKDNLLDELAKGESEVESMEQLFVKIRNNFGETSEEERKIEQLRTIEQGGRTCNEYVQELKRETSRRQHLQCILEPTNP